MKTETYVGAVVGFGLIAESTHLEALATAGLEVVAVVETSPERQIQARKKLPHARIYQDVTSLLTHERLDFVDICTPPHLHFDAIVQAIGAGFHVLCEKPLVLTQEHAEQVARMARHHRVAVACVHNWTAAPIFQRARALLASGVVGDLQHMDVTTLRTAPAATAGDTSNWRIDAQKAGGGILFDHGWHGTSILLRTIQASPKDVRGQVENRRFLDLGVEDTSHIWITFQNGVTGHFEATWAADERANRAELRATEGTIKIHNDTLQVWKDDSLLETELFTESLAGGGYRPAWTAQIVDDFRCAIQDPSKRPALLEEALTTLQILMATYGSASQAGRTLLVGSESPAQPPQALIA